MIKAFGLLRTRQYSLIIGLYIKVTLLQSGSVQLENLIVCKDSEKKN